MRYLILLILFTGCEPNAGRVSGNGPGYRIRVIEGCEYIEVDTGLFDQRVYSLTHKGNCSNHKE